MLAIDHPVSKVETWKKKKTCPNYAELVIGIKRWYEDLKVPKYQQDE